jgi:hypothetical protein
MSNKQNKIGNEGGASATRLMHPTSNVLSYTQEKKLINNKMRMNEADISYALCIRPAMLL